MRLPMPHDLSGSPWRVARPHCCGRAPSEPCVRVIPAHGSSEPRGLAGGRKCWAVAMVGVGPTYAVRMEEAGCDGVARCSRSRFGGHGMPLDRLAGGGEPLLPVVWALRLVLGVQEQSSAAGAAPVLRLE